MLFSTSLFSLILALVSLYWLISDDFSLVIYTLVHVCVIILSTTALQTKRNLHLIVQTFICVPLIHTILILLGAFVFKFFTKTLLVACHISFYIIYPLLYAISKQSHQQPTPITTWHGLSLDPLLSLLFPTKQQTTRVPIRCIIILMCCFLSALAIPLDWDRWWRAWPLPLLFGCELGLLIASTIEIVCYMFHWSVNYSFTLGYDDHPTRSIRLNRLTNMENWQSKGE